MTELPAIPIRFEVDEQPDGTAALVMVTMGRRVTLLQGDELTKDNMYFPSDVLRKAADAMNEKKPEFRMIAGPAFPLQPATLPHRILRNGSG